MKKFACLLLTTLLLATMFAGCGGTSNTSTTAPVAGDEGSNVPASDAVTLKFVRIGNDTAEADYWKALIDRFQEENENIIIEYDDAAIGEAMETKLNTMFSAGLGPDLIGHGIMSVAARAEAGQYMDITDYYNNWEGKDDIMQSVLANGTYNDRIYGLAYSTTPFVFAYRTDLFENAGISAPPKTWDELAEYARKLTVKDGDNITTAGFAFPMTAGNFVEFDVFTFGNGGLYYDEEGNPTLDTPEKAEAFDFLMSFLDEVNMPYSATDVNPFVNGQAAMTLINNVALTSMLNSEEYAGKVGIAVPPSNGNEATFCGCNMLFVGGTSEHPDEAFKFIEAALSAEEVLERAKVLNIPVTRTSQVEAFVELDPMNEVRARCVEVGIGMPRTTWAASFQTVRNQMVQNVLYGEYTPAEALTEAQATLLDEIG